MFMVQGSGLRVEDLGLRVWDSGFGVEGLGSRAWDLGFRLCLACSVLHPHPNLPEVDNPRKLKPFLS